MHAHEARITFHLTYLLGRLLLYEGVLHIKHVTRHFRTRYTCHLCRTRSTLLIVLCADVVLLLLLYANYLNNFVRQVIGT